MSMQDSYEVAAKAICGSEQHRALLAISRKAKALRRAIRTYVKEYEDRDLAEEIASQVKAETGFTADEDFLDEVEYAITEWEGNVFSDASGFQWCLDSFISLIGSELCGSDDEDDADSDDSSPPSDADDTVLE